MLSFDVFSKYIPRIIGEKRNMAGRIREASIGGAWTPQRPVLRVNELKKTNARSARALNSARTSDVYSVTSKTETKIMRMNELFKQILALNSALSSNEFVLEGKHY